MLACKFSPLNQILKLVLNILGFEINSKKDLRYIYGDFKVKLDAVEKVLRFVQMKRWGVFGKKIHFVRNQKKVEADDHQRLIIRREKTPFSTFSSFHI